MTYKEIEFQINIGAAEFHLTGGVFKFFLHIISQGKELIPMIEMPYYFAELVVHAKTIDKQNQMLLVFLQEHLKRHPIED